MMIREQMEAREMTYLSPYAALSKKSKGRKIQEPECDVRTVFQRDRDRILHSKAFRRLKQKTQVFLLPLGDHYRTRLTHTLEVSQNARTIAKALCLNEELVEAISLGHDLGHTPFGHAGERALANICSKGFEHNEQSVRIVERLEKDGKGLNLTWEVIDGIRNHQTSGNPSTLEGKVVRLSDKIAYLNHDVDDAIRGGLLTEEEIPKEIREVLGNGLKPRLNTLIHDVITQSMDQSDIKMSPHVHNAMMELRKFMFSHVYQNSIAKREEEKAIHMIEKMYDYYIHDVDQLPEAFRISIAEGESKETAVCDYIAGMTDNYAVQKFEDIFVPQSWKI